MSGVTLIILTVAVFGAFALSLAFKHLLYICAPNEVLIFSGSTSGASGKRVGYKVIKGGRAFRVPLFEIVDRMDLTNMPIDLEVKGAYSKGGIPLNVVGIANVKIAGHSPVLDNAIERFLGRSRDEIMLIAKETLEGTLRGVLATLTPEEVNEDKMKFAAALLEEAMDDLNRLGLALDTLKIQDVNDDVAYLDSIGRKRSAEIQRKASIAEAEAKSLARVRDATNHRETELKRIEAQTTTVRAENKRRIADAVTKGQAMVAESRGQVAATLARAQADLDVQRARIERERRRLTADVLEPARAEKAARVNQAKAEAAHIIEEGRAQAEAMRHLAATWRLAGTRARDIFRVQKLEPVMREVLATMGDLPVERLTLLGVGAPPAAADGTTSTLAQRLIQGNEELRATLGVDLASAIAARLGVPPPAGAHEAHPAGGLPAPEERGEATTHRPAGKRRRPPHSSPGDVVL